MIYFGYTGDHLSGLRDGEPWLSEIGLSANLYAIGELRLAKQAVQIEEGEDKLGSYQRFMFRFAAEEHPVHAELSLTSYTGGLVVGRVAAAVDNANGFGPQTTFAAVNAVSLHIGQINGLARLTALYRHKPWWSRPYFGTDLRQVPPLTQSLHWQDGRQYAQILPICDDQARTDLCGQPDGLALQISPFAEGLDRLNTCSFVLGLDDQPYRLAANLANAAVTAANVATSRRAQKAYPEILDYLGWCTWDAFYHDVNEQDVLQKAGEFKDLALPVRWVMIDDGWSKIRERMLAGFDADPDKFPQGLGRTVRQLKEQYGIRWAGVWHTILGYWNGLDPESTMARELAETLEPTAGGKIVPAVKHAAGFGFWRAWHGYLKRQGIDFVKVDSQSAVNHVHMHRHPIGEAARGAHDALEASAAILFNSEMINCMGMASENIWQRARSAVSRNSDDFVPQEAGSFREHALQNAYNAVYHGEFYYGDWDMYWSEHEDAVRHMLLRAVSGGPLYVSDALSKTNPDHIRPLVYGDGRIIRCDLPGRPTPDCLFADPIGTPVPLKIWNTSHGSGVVAAFHLHTEDVPAAGTIGMADVPDITPDGEGAPGSRNWVLVDVRKKQMAVLPWDEQADLALSAGECAIYQLTPVRSGVTVLGLFDKLVPIHAVESVRNLEGTVEIVLKEGGEFAFIGESKPIAKVNGKRSECLEDAGQRGLFRVNCADGQGPVRIELSWNN